MSSTTRLGKASKNLERPFLQPTIIYDNNNNNNNE